MLPVRDVVVYPSLSVPLLVGRPLSVNAVDQALATPEKLVLLVLQKDAAVDQPVAEDLYPVGTLARIVHLARPPEGPIKLQVEGIQRVRIDTLKYQSDDERLQAKVSGLEPADLAPRTRRTLMRSLQKAFDSYVRSHPRLAGERFPLTDIEEPGELVDMMSAHLGFNIEDRQRLLEIVEIKERVECCIEILHTEEEALQTDNRIRGRVKEQMEQSQREYYLNEQLKAIQRELGNEGSDSYEIRALREKVEAAQMPKEAREKVDAEMGKLRTMSSLSAEASVVRSYIEWMAGIPWKKRTRIRHDLPEAQQILDKEHYGLKEVKDRVLEYLAVEKRVRRLRGPVLCLVGPPGVGKTSLGESIARCTRRRFVRMSLGGMRDEAEIRGHRRTYVGSLPGKIIQKMHKAGVRNPLFLLDEIDKIGMDFRGDPASALLEVLDPEQNHSFNDHYLEVDYDLSDVLFVCTANTTNIPDPLLDRMETIRIPGYTENEKMEIAARHLIPKQRRRNGLREEEIVFEPEAVRALIQYYTREAGVRGLERYIARICRRLVKDLAMNHDIRTPAVISPDRLEHYCGIRQYLHERPMEENRIGQANGLAWTSVGGELLSIEAVPVPGKGKYVMTGSLGDVMQESIRAAFTFVRHHTHLLGLDERFHESMDYHVHVPSGATPKDGPSAGVAMCMAIISSLTDIPVKADVAMTGEITLHGEVLRVGGIKEKLLAAHRSGIKTVIIPHENEMDLSEVPENVRTDLEIIVARWVREVLPVALEHMPEVAMSSTPIHEAVVASAGGGE